MYLICVGGGWRLMSVLGPLIINPCVSRFSYKIRTFFVEPMKSHVIKSSLLTCHLFPPSLALRPWAHSPFNLCCLLIPVSSGTGLVRKIKVLKASSPARLSLGGAESPEDFHNRNLSLPTAHPPTLIIASLHQTPFISSLIQKGFFACVCILSPTRLSDGMKRALNLLLSSSGILWFYITVLTASW